MNTYCQDKNHCLTIFKFILMFRMLGLNEKSALKHTHYHALKGGRFVWLFNVIVMIEENI